MRKISRCQILTQKCIKIDFGWGSAPDPAGGTYSAPPDLLAGLKGPTSKVRARTQEEAREGNGEGGKRGGEGGERRGRGSDIPVPDWESEKVATLTGAEVYHGHLSLDLKSVGVPTYCFNWADRE